MYTTKWQMICSADGTIAMFGGFQQPQPWFNVVIARCVDVFLVHYLFEGSSKYISWGSQACMANQEGYKQQEFMSKNTFCSNLWLTTLQYHPQPRVSLIERNIHPGSSSTLFKIYKSFLHPFFPASFFLISTLSSGTFTYKNLTFIHDQCRYKIRHYDYSTPDKQRCSSSHMQR